MTREEHIENLETIGCDGWTVTTEAYKSLQWAIKALEQEPCNPSGGYKVVEKILFYLDGREKVANDEWVSFEFKELQKFIQECLKEYKVEGSDNKE
jgi:hypothetical protein